MKSIALVLPYFGKFPNYFQLWLDSCKRNPTINFLIFTDIESEHTFPANVSKVHISFEELKERIQKLYDFKVNLENPYRLCIFKTAYGEIFEKELKDFDFWGHCDCDLIWGNIRKFITDDILNKHDRILSRGHLTIYRNTPETNSFYKTKDEDTVYYKKCFSQDAFVAFDEWGGTSRLWKKYNPERFYDKIIFDDVNVSKKQFTSSQRVIILEEKPEKYLYYTVKESALFRIHSKGKEEIAYVHFQKRHMDIGKDLKEDEYIIVPNKFIAYDENFESKKFTYFLHCRNRLIYPAYIKLRAKNLWKKIKSLQRKIF